MLRIALFLLVVSILFGLGKMLKAKKILGRRISIKPLRKQSKLLHFPPLELEVTEVVKYSREEYYLQVLLDEEVTVGEQSFDFLHIKPKSVDDNVNTKKPVVCIVKGGHSSDPTNMYFIDWGVVKAL